MDFILPILGVFIGTLIIPVLILPVFSTGFFLSKQHKKPYPFGRFLTGMACICFGAFCFMVILFFLWCTAVDYSMQNPHRGEDKAKAFGVRFRTVSERLCNARDENDPVINEFKSILKDSGLSGEFRLGPTHYKQRELAINDDVIFYAICMADGERWFVGLPASLRVRGAERAEYVGRAVVDNSSFKFAAKRNGNRIDVRLFTSIYCDQKWQNPPIDFLKANLSDDLYIRWLGQITLCPLRLAEAENALPIDKVNETFLQLLSEQERRDLSSTFTERPVVQRRITQKRTQSNYDANNFQSRYSDYFPSNEKLKIIETRVSSEISPKVKTHSSH